MSHEDVVEIKVALARIEERIINNSARITKLEALRDWIGGAVLAGIIPVAMAINYLWNLLPHGTK